MKSGQLQLKSGEQQPAASLVCDIRTLPTRVGRVR